MILSRTDINCGTYQLSGLSECVSTAGCELLVKDVVKALKAKTVCHYGSTEATCRVKNAEQQTSSNWIRGHARPKVIMFSTRVKLGNGEKLKQYIIDNGYGDIQESEVFVNHSIEERECVIYLWYLNYEALGITELLQHYK